MTTANTGDHVDGVDGAVVVGVDGSDSSLQALAWAAEHARVTGRRLVAITTWQWPSGYGAIVPWPSDVDFEQDASQILHDAVEKTLGAEQAAQMTQLVIQGHPAPVLVDASESAAIVVVGSRGHGAFAGMLLGSVSEFLATHGHCPVVIIRN